MKLKLSMILATYLVPQHSYYSACMTGSIRHCAFAVNP